MLRHIGYKKRDTVVYEVARKLPGTALDTWVMAQRSVQVSEEGFLAAHISSKDAGRSAIGVGSDQAREGLHSSLCVPRRGHCW